MSEDWNCISTWSLTGPLKLYQMVELYFPSNFHQHQHNYHLFWIFAQRLYGTFPKYFWIPWTRFSAFLPNHSSLIILNNQKSSSLSSFITFWAIWKTPPGPGVHDAVCNKGQSWTFSSQYDFRKWNISLSTWRLCWSAGKNAVDLFERKHWGYTCGPVWKR